MQTSSLLGKWSRFVGTRYNLMFPSGCWGYWGMLDALLGGLYLDGTYETF